MPCKSLGWGIDAVSTIDINAINTNAGMTNSICTCSNASNESLEPVSMSIDALDLT